MRTMEPRSGITIPVLLSILIVASYAHQIGGCGENLSAPMGDIASPGHPDHYPNDVDCVWTVRVPDGHTIEVVIKDLELDNNDTHCLDWLEIRDGLTQNSPILVKACQACSVPHTIYTTGPHAYLRFQSDDVFHYTGFLVSYRQTPLVSSGSQRDSAQQANQGDSKLPLIVGLCVGVPLLIIAIILIIIIVCLTIKNERLHRDAA